MPAGPNYQDHCPVRLHSTADGCDDAAGLMALAAIEALDRQAGSAGDDHEFNAAELKALDDKLNLLIQMFASFWRQQAKLPAVVPVTLTAAGVSLPRNLPGADGPISSVELFLHPALPQALCLPVEPVPSSTGGERLELRFHGLSEELQDALSRHVFRRHRRAIAGRRQQN